MDEIIFQVIISLVIIQMIWYVFQLIMINLIPTKQADRKDNVSITVIIAARNELENLPDLFEGLESQTYDGKWELILVLDRCTDDSAIWLKDCKPNFPLMIIEQSELDIPNGHSPKKTALKRAIIEANGEFILQTDADCYPRSQNWIQSFANIIETDTDLVLGLSPYEKAKGILNSLIQYDTLWTHTSMLALSQVKLNFMGLGRNMAFRKSTFLKNGAYDSHISIAYGDDDLLVQSFKSDIKIKLLVNEESHMISIPEKILKSWLHQKQRHMMAGKEYKLKYRVILLLSYLSIMIYVFSLLAIFTLSKFVVLIIGLLVLKNIIISIPFFIIARKIKFRISYFELIICDIMHSFVITTIGIKALLRKRIEWG